MVMENPGREPVYRLYGRLWSSGEDLDHLFPRTDGPADCRYRLGLGPEPGDWETHAPLYESPIPDVNGDPRLKIWREAGRVRAFFSGSGAYHLTEDEIVCHPLPGADRPVRDNLLLGAVSAFWLELRGLATLHASAAALEDGAVGFVSHSGGGKSSLAALMMKAGWDLLTDDVLPLEMAGDRVLGWPGYPMMRMWPPEARHFLGDTAAHLSQVHPSTPKLRVPLSKVSLGAFHDRPTRLRRLYLPAWHEEEGETEVRIEPLTPREGLIELVRYSFAPLVVRALGLEADRLALLSQTALKVPVRRLLHPRGFEHLSEVRAAIERDLGPDAGALLK